MSAATKNKAAKPAAEAPKSSGLGLEGLGDLSSLLSDKAPADLGEAIELELALIDEDPNQPRQHFAEAEMAELTASIDAHGVLLPISVHANPNVPGRYIINEGARRVRASLRLNKATIKANITEPFTVIQQLVVNQERADTPAKDKAEAYQRYMKEHDLNQKEFAKAANLSEAYVAMHLGLLKMAAPIAEAFDSGRVADVTLVAELGRVFKKSPDAVKEWLAVEDQEITRGSVRLLRDFIENKGGNGAGGADDEDDGAGAGGDAPGKGSKESNSKEGAKAPKSDPSKIKKAFIVGTYQDRSARLITGKRWSADGLAWIKFDDDGQEVEIDIGEFKLNRLIEG
jgi:ParB family chromosome partitioning protein